MSDYYKQLHRHDPSEGLIGDCWRTCIANLMGLKPTEVPHFAEKYFAADGGDASEFFAATRAWLALRGLALVTIAVNAGCLENSLQLSQAPYIIGGRTGLKDVGHVCLGHGHLQILHDPSGEESALQPYKDVDGGSYYWLHFLIPINLAEFLKKPVPAPLL